MLFIYFFIFFFFHYQRYHRPCKSSYMYAALSNKPWKKIFKWWKSCRITSFFLLLAFFLFLHYLYPFWKNAISKMFGITTFFLLCERMDFYSSRKIIVRVCIWNKFGGCSAGYHHNRTAFLSTFTKSLSFTNKKMWGKKAYQRLSNLPFSFTSATRSKNNFLMCNFIAGVGEGGKKKWEIGLPGKKT